MRIFLVQIQLNAVFFVSVITHIPVVAVDIIQPAPLLYDLHRAGAVFPRCETVPPLVFVAVAGLNAAAVGAVLLPAGIVIDALLCL